ncbi:MAG: hypothetical protein QW461_00345 [Candidatus Jordarchaeales archaeon]
METPIEVHPEKCTACLSCQLACSFKNYGFFSPSKSMIKVSRLGTKVSIEFLPGCKGCFECVKWCFYGALKPRKTSN